MLPPRVVLNNFDRTPVESHQAVNASPQGRGCWSAMGMAFNLVTSSSSFIGSVGGGCDIGYP